MSNWIICPRRDGLVWEWLLNGNALDTSWNNNNWTGTNITYTQSFRWYQKQCGVFNGSSSYVTFTNNQTFTSLSLSAWVYNTTTASTNNSIVVNNWANNNSILFDLWTNNKVPRFWLKNSSGTQVEINSATWLVLNSWNHIIATWDWTTMKLFVNNVQVASGSFSGTLSITTTWNIGKYTSSADYFNWNIQSVRLFNRVLSTDEIQNWYLEWLRKLWGGSMSVLMDGLVAYYDMRGDANDIVGGNNGTVTGATLTTDRFWMANGAYSFNGTSSRINVSTNLYWTWALHSTMVNFNISSLPTSWNTQFLYCNVVDWWTSWSFFIWNDAWTIKAVSINYYTTWSISLVWTYSFQTWVDYCVLCNTDSTWMKIYVNWSLLSSNSNTWTFRTTANSFGIWCQPQSPSSFFNWKIYDLSIYNVSKSASEVKALYDLSKLDYILPFN